MPRKAWVVAGLMYGDEGKGALVDYLVRRHRAGLVVRYNGGAQAAHNVVTSDNRHHTFSQFGSGSFVPGVRTHLSRYVMINPLTMIAEEEHLQTVGVHDAFQLTTVEDTALITTPFHVAANRLCNYHGSAMRHNTCGMGIAQTRQYFEVHGDRVLFAGDLKSESITKAKLRFLQTTAYQNIANLSDYQSLNVPYEKASIEHTTLSSAGIIDAIWHWYKDWPARIVDKDYLPRELERQDALVFEGAQGVLLDEAYGDTGFNTWTNTTFGNANALLSHYDGAVERIGVMRSYATRHGDGPFTTEDIALWRDRNEAHNDSLGFSGRFRVGHFDNHALKASLSVVSPDTLAMSHLDRCPDMSWEERIHGVEDLTGLEVKIRGFGPSATDWSSIDG